MSSTYGETIKLSINGSSHGPFVGMQLNGVPAGLPVDWTDLQNFLNRRAPGHNDWSSPRREDDVPEFQSGINGNFTSGKTITAIIKNKNAKPVDYANLRDCPRPGHADYTARIKYGSDYDISGGGVFSGRMTAPLCIAGGLCKQWLAAMDIQIGAHISVIAGIADEPMYLDWVDPDLRQISTDFPVLNADAGTKMQQAILQAHKEGDSVGGIIECIVAGLPAGIGGPLFDGMESRIAQIIYSIPGVKGIDFGSGFGGSFLRGSENNDQFAIHGNKVKTVTNNAGGILGGITNGMPLVFRVAIKPTPSISRPQQSISLSDMKPQTLEIKGRHDPCIVPRAVPVVEAAAAIAVYDACLSGNLCKE